MNFGPQHPATHTTLRLILKLDGERVVEAIPDIGYLHSGFEKLGESLDYNQYVTVTDRMNYISPMANNVAWHLAVEKLLGIDVPPRCQYLRVIVAELARHQRPPLVQRGGRIGHRGLYLFPLRLQSPRADLRHLRGPLWGPLHQQLYACGRADVRCLAQGDRHDPRLPQALPKVLEDIRQLLDRNRIFVDRTKGIGLLSKEEAVNRSVTGPIARASGVTRDLRKDEPYLAYKDFDFQVCCAPPAIVTPDTWCAWWRWNRARTLSSRRSRTFRRDR